MALMRKIENYHKERTKFESDLTQRTEDSLQWKEKYTTQDAALKKLQLKVVELRALLIPT